MKHAFLIMIHSNYDLVSRLLKKLDHSNNTIYIHVDAKSTFSDEDETLLVNSCKDSKVIFVDRYPVNWGGYSQIRCELHMLKVAFRQKYDYYHFLSGVDFPIKSMEHIHDFFNKNIGYEFVHFCSDEFTQSHKNRYCLYHFFQEKCARKNNFYMIVKRALLLIQKMLKVNRARKYPNIQFKCGSNWVSITHDAVSYTLSKEKEIKKMFSHSFCCDEFFLQTIIYNSNFKEKIFCVSDENNVFSNMRSVDWERGNKKLGSPYTYTDKDYEQLINSKNLFCRKVSDSTPEENALIEKLEQL